MEDKKQPPPTYYSMLGFVIPLAFMPFMMGIGRQFINGGMARMPDARVTLAAFGLAFGLVNLISAVLMEARQMGLVLAESRQALKSILKFILAFSLIPVLILVLLALTPVGTWVIRDLHGVSSELGAQVVFALLCLIPLPFFNSLTGLLNGLIISSRNTVLVSSVTLITILVRIGLVFILLAVPAVRARPILLPILVTYGGLVVQLSILGLASIPFIRQLPAESSQPLKLSYIFHFFWPLAIVKLSVGGSRPLLNLLVSRGANGEEALAILAVVFPLANMPYGWVNQNRSLVAAFRDHTGGRKKLRRFALGCGLLSFFGMILLFWTPIRDFILMRWIGLTPELTVLCKWPLILFVFFPLAVMVRAYSQGVALAEHRTKAMLPSAPTRLAAILIIYVLLSLTPLHGAVTGTIALLSGFASEAMVVRFCIRRARRKERESGMDPRERRTPT